MTPAATSAATPLRARVRDGAAAGSARAAATPPGRDGAAGRVARAAATLLALALAACATAPANPDARSGADVPLPAYASHEECLTLNPGDRLDYRFRSTAPIAFSIQYREAGAVVMPLERQAVSADSGIYQPLLSHHFCLTWEAGPAPATLEYQVGVRRRAAP